MHLGDIAFELQLQVLQLCSLKDLASLSREHSSLRDVTDYALYSHIRCLTFATFQSTMETLATNMQKASLVKVLDLQFVFYKIPQGSLKIMARALPNMLNLSELRISIAEAALSEDSNGIIKAIRSVSFQAMMMMMGGERPSGAVISDSRFYVWRRISVTWKVLKESSPASQTYGSSDSTAAIKATSHLRQ